MRGKFIAYYCVSTDKQGKSGLGLDAQRKAVRDYLDGGCWELVGEFTEIESGKRSNRPELEKAIAACKKHRTRLIIAKLDRLSRNVAFISALMERKVDFIAVDNPTATKFSIHILAAVAEFERDPSASAPPRPSPQRKRGASGSATMHASRKPSRRQRTRAPKQFGPPSHRRCTCPRTLRPAN